MTRPFRLLSLGAYPLIITNLSRPDAPITLDPGREIDLSIHDDNLGVFIGKQKMSDVQHPELGERGQTWAGMIDGGESKLTDDEKDLIERRRRGEIIGYADGRQAGTEGEQLMVWNGESAVALEDMTKEQLIEEAKHRGVDVDEDDTKAMIVDKINA